MHALARPASTIKHCEGHRQSMVLSGATSGQLELRYNYSISCTLACAAPSSLKLSLLAKTFEYTFIGYWVDV